MGFPFFLQIIPEVQMKHLCSVALCILITGCGGGNSVKLGTTQVTALAPSHTFVYGNPGSAPPNIGKNNIPGKTNAGK